MSVPGSLFYKPQTFAIYGVSPLAEKILNDRAKDTKNYLLAQTVLSRFNHCPAQYREFLHPDELALLFAGFPMRSLHHIHCLAQMGLDEMLPSPLTCTVEQLSAMTQGYMESGRQAPVKIVSPPNPMEILVQASYKNDYDSFKILLNSFHSNDIDWNILVCALVANRANNVLYGLLRDKTISLKKLYSISESQFAILDSLLPYALKKQLGGKQNVGLSEFNLGKLALLYGNVRLAKKLKNQVQSYRQEAFDRKYDTLSELLERRHVKLAAKLQEEWNWEFLPPLEACETVLHSAMHCHFEILQQYPALMKSLSSYAKKNVNHEDGYGKTALSIAVTNKQLPAIQWLLGLGANPTTAVEAVFELPDYDIFSVNTNILIDIVNAIDPQKQYYEKLFVQCLHAICVQHIYKDNRRVLPFKMLMDMLEHLANHLNHAACEQAIGDAFMIGINEYLKSTDIENLSQLKAFASERGFHIPVSLYQPGEYSFMSHELEPLEGLDCSPLQKKLKVADNDENESLNIACAGEISW